MEDPRTTLGTTAPIILSGTGAMLIQVVCLRQLLVIFAGNELVIGIVLAFWLAAVAGGSLVGHRFRAAPAFAVVLMAAGIISQLTLLLIGSARALLDIGPGETVSLAATMGITALCLTPVCAAIGMIFPMAVSFSGSPTSKVYGLEAAGAFLGGLLFTSLLAGRVGPYMTAALASVLFLAACVMVLRRRRYLLLLLMPPLLYAATVRLDIYRAQQYGGLVSKTESRYGEIAVFRMGDQLNFFESGKFLFSYPDPQTDELRVHLPVSVHPLPESILLVGGSPAAAAVLAGYPAVRIDYVEMDPALINVSLDQLSPADRGTISSRGVRLISEDGRRFIKRARPVYDLIIMNLPDPSTAAVNRMYTVDFIREARSALRPGGILSIKIPTSSGYIGRRMRTVNGSIFRSLRAVFQAVAPSSEEYGYLFASDSPIDTDPATLAARFSGRGIASSHFRPFIFRDAFDPLKVEMVRSRLDSVNILNTDARPAAYLYSLMLWADVYGRFVNRFLGATTIQVMYGAGAAALTVCLFFAARRRAVYFSALTTGYTSMAFTVVVLLSYQAAFGHVYEMVGLLSAFFMAGMAAGSFAVGGDGRSLSLLRLAEGSAVVFFISSRLLFKTEVSYAAACALCGLVSGICFGAAGRCISGTGPAGRLYAADLAGSFAGALLSVLLFIPIAGVHNTVYSLAGIKSLSLLLLLTVKDETR